jgi:hypothetical protein
MTIRESLDTIIQAYDRRFYVQRNFNGLAALAGLFVFVFSLVLSMMQWMSWPWVLSLWSVTAGAYFICRSRWLQADSDIIGSAMEKFNQAFPVNTSERKIAMNALEEMSSASVTAAMILALFGSKKSLHYYYGWTEPAVTPHPETAEETEEPPVAKKRLKISGIIPLQTKKKISDIYDNPTNDKCISLDPDRTGKKNS